NRIKARHSGVATAGKKVFEFGSNMASLGKYLYYTALDGDHLNDWITPLPESSPLAALATGQAVSTIRGHIRAVFGATMKLGKDLL
ncbi:hypothetical protein, partial [Bacillus paranthracis]|uniref:hypothetical protein n=1 Tax=Bacillus paranthracis TaxID=2026186 RepID=UPI0028418FB4